MLRALATVSNAILEVACASSSIADVRPDAGAGLFSSLGARLESDCESARVCGSTRVHGCAVGLGAVMPAAVRVMPLASRRLLAARLILLLYPRGWFIFQDPRGPSCNCLEKLRLESRKTDPQTRDPLKFYNGPCPAAMPGFLAAQEQKFRTSEISRPRITVILDKCSCVSLKIQTAGQLV